MNFNQFSKEIIQHFNKNMKGLPLMVLNVNTEKLWETYLDNANQEIYVSKRKDDCNCCRHFIEKFGGLVAIAKDDKLISLWDFKSKTDYEKARREMQNLCNQSELHSILQVDSQVAGTKSNFSEFKNTTFNHLHIPDLKCKLNQNSNDFLQRVETLKRGLEEITIDSLELTLDLALDDNLYRADPTLIDGFLSVKKGYDKTKDKKTFLFKTVYEQKNLSFFRNSLIGTLLLDLSNGENWEQAIGKYENKASGENYKRKKPLVSNKQKERCLKKLKELDLLDSLDRRFANLSDINVKDVIFANRDLGKEIKGIESLLSSNDDSLKKGSAINYQDFIDLIKTSNNVELFVDDKLTKQFIGLTTSDSNKSPFKWSNGLSWSYRGGMADSSIKKEVSKQGGNVNGKIRFSLMWNTEENQNLSDLDAWAEIKTKDSKGKISFRNKSIAINNERGRLDIDIICPKGIAVENIYWQDIPTGDYEITFKVNEFSKGDIRGGFKAEIHLDGKSHFYEQEHCNYGSSNTVEVGKIISKNGNIKIVDTMKKSVENGRVWNIELNNYIPVSCIMKSPNHLLAPHNEHLFLMLDNCYPPLEEKLNSFFTEFLIQDLQEHSRVMEMISQRTKLQGDCKSLCGIGFQKQRNFNFNVKIDNRPYTVSM